MLQHSTNIIQLLLIISISLLKHTATYSNIYRQQYRQELLKSKQQSVKVM